MDILNERKAKFMWKINESNKNKEKNYIYTEMFYDNYYCPRGFDFD